MPDRNAARALKPEEKTTIVVEQYKVLAGNLDKINENRETSNNFWVSVNGLCISALAYLRDTQSILRDHKPLVLWTLIIIGISFCLSWLLCLKTINNSIAMRTRLLIEVEANLPLPLFTKLGSTSSDKADRPLLTLEEMAVPCLFLGGYFFFGALLLFFSRAVIAPASI